MRQEYYYQYQGLRRSINSPAAPQVAALLLENFMPNRLAGGWVKRPGSKLWPTTGDVLGIDGYTQANASYRVPQTIHVIRHRRSGSTSFIERYDSATDTWIAITQSANTAFSSLGFTTFAQLSNFMVIGGGRPAFLTDPVAGTVQRLGGPAPTTAPTWTLGAGSLTGNAYGFYTFYNSTTGWESSPSPITAFTSLSANQITWSALETTVAKAGVTHKNLYRTQLSGEVPYYRVTQVTLATTTYVDNVLDTSLGIQGPDFNDHDAPPDDVYTVIEYEGHIFLASGNLLYFSKPYTGSLADLEYFSADRLFVLPQRITGLGYSPDFGRLFVFQPVGYGIYTISGRTKTQFTKELYKKEDGTNFQLSVKSHANMLAYWGQNGPTIITPSGPVENFAADTKETTREIAIRVYNSDVNIFTVFNPVWGEAGTFLFFFSARDTATALWEDYGIATVADWQDIFGADTGWQ